MYVHILFIIFYTIAIHVNFLCAILCTAPITCLLYFVLFYENVSFCIIYCYNITNLQIIYYIYDFFYPNKNVFNIILFFIVPVPFVKTLVL